MKEYDIVYSIGRDCANSMFLMRRGLRVTSGPFDWLTKADFETRIQLILDEFKNFLNKEDLNLLPELDEKNKNRGHVSYANTRTDFYFYHDFPSGISLDESYPEVKEKYERRIKRFLDNLNNKQKVLLVWFSHIPTVNKLDIQALCDSVCNKFGKQIDFLLIEHDENIPKGVIRRKTIADNIEYCTLYTQSYDEFGKLTTLGRKEDIFPIYAGFSLPGLEKRMRSEWLKRLAGRFFSAFIPVRKWRKHVRNKFK